MEKLELPEPNRVVMTLKPDMVYQDKAPVNGRKVVASDIVATQEYVKQMPNPEKAGFQRNFLDRMRGAERQYGDLPPKEPDRLPVLVDLPRQPHGPADHPEGDAASDRDRTADRQRPLRAHRPHLQHQVQLQEVRELPKAKKGMPYFEGRTILASGRRCSGEPPSAATRSRSGCPNTPRFRPPDSELDPTKSPAS